MTICFHILCDTNSISPVIHWKKEAVANVNDIAYWTVLKYRCQFCPNNCVSKSHYTNAFRYAQINVTHIHTHTVFTAAANQESKWNSSVGRLNP